MAALDLERDGAALHPAALDADALGALRRLADEAIGNRPGARMGRDARLDALLAAGGEIGRIARSALGQGSRAVRAVMFDKSAAANWAVAWHQDRTIAVRDRIEAVGFGPWSRKDGVLHVAPPVGVLEAMVTLRLHLDDCAVDNAPLLAALGSHRGGVVPATEARAVAERRPVHVCLARAGDIWAYRTLILHASERAARPTRRRVLQVDFAAADLPGGLVWHGLDAA